MSAPDGRRSPLGRWRGGRPRPPARSEDRQQLLRWLKFNGVGFVGIAVQLGALTAFRSWVGLDYLVATGLAVETAVIHNFAWHERFTWADRPARHWSHSLLRLAKFNITNGAVSILGNLALMRLLVAELHWNYAVANLAAIGVCTLLNFILGDRFVFEVEKSGVI
jgi:putative flippase GtrA